MQHKKIFERMISLLVAKIIICILAFVSFIAANWFYEENRWNRTRLSNALAIIGIILGFVFCVLLIVTNWNLFTIPKILLFITICILLAILDLLEPNVPFWIGVVVTVVAFIISGIMYLNNIEKCEVPDVSTTKNTVICAKDNSSITGEFYGSIIYEHGSVSEENIYKYYYELEDGGIKQSSIPVDDTTIYFVGSGEEAYLETIVTTEYWLNNNKKPAKRCLETTETTYKLYVPKGSVTNVYEFNAE